MQGDLARCHTSADKDSGVLEGHVYLLKPPHDLYIIVESITMSNITNCCIYTIIIIIIYGRFWSHGQTVTL